MAIAALVLGIIGILLCFIAIPSLLAIVLGLIAARTIKSSGGSVTGLGLARAGWVLGLIGLAAGVAFWVAAATGAFDEEGSTRLDDLEIGACVNVGDLDGDVIGSLPTVACTVPHDGEVFHFGELNSDRDRDFPGDEAAQAEAAAACVGEPFTEYVGVPYEDSRLVMFTIHTRDDLWSKDRGWYTCIAYSRDGRTLNESVRGSGR